MSGEDLHAQLAGVAEEFDLGSYEIEAYLAVLEHGDLTATEIAAETDVPQPRVYDTVRTLADRGLVELRESQPMRVVALDPESAFVGFRRSLEDLVARLGERYQAPTRDGEAVSLVRSRDAITRHLEAAVEAAEYELTLSLTPTLLEGLADDIAAAVARGVRTALLVTPGGEAPDPADYDYTRVSMEARARRGVVTPVLAVADGYRSVYATQDAVAGGADHYAVLFNRSALGFLVSGFFWTVLWTTAEPLAAAEPERQFPRRYASVRRAITDIEGVRAELYATVEGRDVLTGETRVVRGRIAEAHLSGDEEFATIVLETDDGELTVGGRVAAYEDIEAHELRVNVGAPPPRDGD